MIRNILPADLTAAKTVIDSSGLFPSELLDDMIAPYFDGNPAEQRWIGYEDGDELLGLAFHAPEEMTDGTHNLYLIAVQKAAQGKGIGTTLMTDVEDHLRRSGQRILIVETSGLDGFELTRKFYDKLGYSEEARIREFYAACEDKVVFWKML
ncbi:MAG: GNAT family N-acetyltransferase [Saprospiraceae bacterium]